MPNKVKLVHPHSKSVVTFNLSLENFFRPIQITLVFLYSFLSLMDFRIFQEYLGLFIRSAGYRSVSVWCHLQTVLV